MNISRLVRSQKILTAETIPGPLTIIRKTNSAYGDTLSANSVVFASAMIKARIEEFVQPLYLPRTGVF